MKPEVWGPAIWTFMHVFVRKLRPEMYPQAGYFIFNILVRICANLPCPTCTMHAMQFWRQVRFGGIRSKKDLEHIVFLFHNIVNERKKKPAYDETLIADVYNGKKLSEVFASFAAVYAVRGDSRFMADSLQRSLIIKDIVRFVRSNVSIFNA